MSSECHETAVVTELQDRTHAVVLITRAEACGACAARGSCSALGGQKKDINLVLENRIQAQPGDVVKISVKETAVLKASVVLYLFPALCLIALAAIGNMLAPMLRLSVEAGAIVGALLGLLVGLGGTYVLGKVLAKDKSFVPAMVEVIRK